MGGANDATDSGGWRISVQHWNRERSIMMYIFFFSFLCLDSSQVGFWFHFFFLVSGYFWPVYLS
ncbi:uncharacterized protein BDW47DRAFT_106922 [Aspergillus candidus]|uniref:Uncharacterized protein n=1 Tax=Aspergillus candidus TaxID=41067 RepID=A0A2I2F9U2_ASPCN|nr:hypothetical protein BDW47DRAFT_106922 [Aspergillus candidus]PLB37375.1 hypothetical protein BDW47DRAFT_106922 [Aspergillus candidus]